MSNHSPPAWWRALAGIVSAAGAVGAGHLVALLLAPASSPLVAIASRLVDAAPTGVKNAVIAALGTADKPVLITAVAVVLAVLAAVAGLLAWRHRRWALVLVAVLGLTGLVAALAGGGDYLGLENAVAPLIATGVGVGSLAAFSTTATRRAGTGPEGGSPGDSSPAGRQSRRDTTTPGAHGDAGAGAGAGAPTLLRPSRRDLLGGAGLVSLAALSAGASRVPTPVRTAPPPLPAPVSPAGPIPAGAQVPGAVDFLTPADRFYRIDIALTTPRVDVAGWELVIDGAVDRPLRLSYADLLAMPMIERTITLACVSNDVGGPYVSTATWLGVPMADLIDRAGVHEGVDQLFSYSSQGGYTCSTPYRPLTDGRDAMIAVGMNGGPLPDAHGFPARMVVPGLFGFVSATKWLSRLEFTTYDQRSAYWTERGWVTDSPVITQTRVDRPAGQGVLPADDPVLAGTAWATHRGIDRVEVRFDQGPWHEATLGESAGDDVWRQWSIRFDGPPGRHTAQVRATDGTGALQDEREVPVYPGGATGWQQVSFTVR